MAGNGVERVAGEVGYLVPWQLGVAEELVSLTTPSFELRFPSIFINCTRRPIHL